MIYYIKKKESSEYYGNTIERFETSSHEEAVSVLTELKNIQLGGKRGFRPYADYEIYFGKELD